MENQLLDSDMLNNKEGKSLSALLANGYQTSSVEYIKKGFEIFKQNIVGFLGFLLLLGIIQYVVSLIPYVKILSYALISPIVAGVYIVAKMIDKNEPYTFSNFFDGTKNYIPLLFVSIIPTLIIAVIYLVVGGWDYFKIAMLGIRPDVNFNDLSSLTAYANSMSGFGARVSIAAILSGIVSIFFLFSTFFVLFEHFEPLRAIDTSRKVIGKKFFNWLGFLLLLVLFNVAGALCLLVGLLVTIPSSVCALYVAYEDVVGLDLKD